MMNNMNLILLPGNSKENKSWIENVEKTLNDIFDTSYIQYYQHWADGSSMIDINFEEDILKSKLIEVPKTEYSVFAKSAGCLLTIKAINDNVLNPKYCIFTGFPSHFARQLEIPFEEYLINASSKSALLFIQKSKDPASSFKELNDMVVKCNLTCQMEKIPGDNHKYDDLQLLKKIISEFIDLK